MWGRSAAKRVGPRGTDALHCEDTVLRAIEVMQRTGIEAAVVLGTRGEVLGTVAAAELYRAWSLDPLTLLKDLFRAPIVAVRSEDRERGWLSAEALLGRGGR